MTPRLAIGWAGGVVVLLGAIVMESSSVGCTTHDCDPTCVLLYGESAPASPPGGATECASPSAPLDDAYLNGDEVIWETAPFDGAWLNFPGGSWLLLSWQAAVDGATRGTQYQGWSVVPITVEPYVSTAQRQPAGTVILASSQPAELQQVGDTGVWVNNASCADYYLRVVASLRLVPPGGAGAPEAGTVPPLSGAPSH